MEKLIDVAATEAGQVAIILLICIFGLLGALKLLWARLNQVMDQFIKISTDNVTALNGLTNAVDKVADRVK